MILLKDLFQNISNRICFTGFCIRIRFPQITDQKFFHTLDILSVRFTVSRHFTEINPNDVILVFVFLAVKKFT